MLYHIALFFHFVSIILVAGGSIGTVLVENQLWKKIWLHSGDARGLFPFFEVKSKLIKAGIVLFLLSGIALLYSVQWVYLSQPWFIAKFLLFLSLPFRGVLIEQKLLSKIQSVIISSPAGGYYDLALLTGLRSKLNRFHIIQFSIVAAILSLVIFKI